MPEDRDKSTNDDAILAVGGVLFIGAPVSGRSRVWVGPTAGWMVPRGIAQWERELSFVARSGMTPALASALRATVPDAQIAPRRFPGAKKAVDAAPFLAISSNLVDDVRSQGVRVHTVGVDRVSGDFYYFEEGGSGDPVRVQGNLVEMLSPSVGSSSTNAEIAATMEGLIDRLLLSLSGGQVSELAVELADALPRLSRDGTGLQGTDLDVFEAQVSRLAAQASRWETAARRIPQVLDEAGLKASTTVPLFGEARRDERPALEVLVGGKSIKLPGPSVWSVTGTPREDAKPAPSPAAVRPSPSPVPVRPSPSPVPVRPSPSPVRPSPSPIPARPSPTPAPSRVVVIGDAPAGIKPAPLRLTPIPPRPEPIASPPPAAVAPAPEPAPAPAVVAAPAPEPEPVAAAAPEVAPAPASARESAPESARESEPESVAARAPAPASVPARSAPAKKSSSSSTLVLALLALAALAYVAFERFIH